MTRACRDWGHETCLCGYGFWVLGSGSCVSVRKCWGFGEGGLGEEGIRVVLRVMEGGAGYGGCWGIRVLRVVGLGVEEVELLFLPLERGREGEKKRERERLVLTKLGEVD